MKIGSSINPEVFNIIPGHFTFPEDEAAFRDYHRAHPGSIYIAKPVASSEGNSISLFKDLSEIPSLLSHSMVVQRYIHNPLLVDGLKFDLRVYVVLVSTQGEEGGCMGNKISAYVCEEGLARFCTVSESYV
jgi:hypothetical protein